MNNEPLANANSAFPTTTHEKRMSRMEYLLLRGPLKTRILTYVALGLILVSLVLVIIMGCKTFYGSILDMPILQMFIPESEIAVAKETLSEGVDVLFAELSKIDDEIADLTPEERRELEEEIMEEEGVTLEEYTEQLKAELIKQFEEETGIPFKVAEDLVATFSLHSIMEFLEHVPEAAEADEIFAVVKILYKGLIGFFLLSGALIVLSAIFIKKWTLILEFVLSFGGYLMFGGTIMTVALFVLMIAYCIIQSNVQNEWKQYKYGF